MSFFVEIDEKDTRQIDYLSPSSLDCFARCPAKFCFAKVMRLEKQNSYKTPLIFGKCIHAGIYAAYDDPDYAGEIFNDLWRQEGGDSLNDDSRNPTSALLMYQAFYQFHKAKMYIPLSPPGGITITKERYNDFEAPVMVDLGGAYPLYGKIDRLVKWNDHIFPLDYKTSSMITDNTCQNFNVCTQTLAYTLMASVLYSSILKGILYEFLRVTKKETSHETYLHPVYVRDHWLKTFIEWYIYQSNLIKKMLDEKRFHKNPSACAAYGQYGIHGYPCEFADLCEAEDWRDMIKYFDRNDFNPLDGIDEKEIKILSAKGE